MGRRWGDGRHGHHQRAWLWGVGATEFELTVPGTCTNTGVEGYAHFGDHEVEVVGAKCTLPGYGDSD